MQVGPGKCVVVVLPDDWLTVQEGLSGLGMFSLVCLQSSSVGQKKTMLLDSKWSAAEIGLESSFLFLFSLLPHTQSCLCFILPVLDV